MSRNTNSSNKCHLKHPNATLAGRVDGQCGHFCGVTASEPAQEARPALPCPARPTRPGPCGVLGDSRHLRLCTQREDRARERGVHVHTWCTPVLRLDTARTSSGATRTRDSTQKRETRPGKAQAGADSGETATAAQEMGGGAPWGGVTENNPRGRLWNPCGLHGDPHPMHTRAQCAAGSRVSSDWKGSDNGGDNGGLLGLGQRRPWPWRPGASR